MKRVENPKVSEGRKEGRKEGIKSDKHMTNVTDTETVHFRGPIIDPIFSRTLHFSIFPPDFAVFLQIPEEI